MVTSPPSRSYAHNRPCGYFSPSHRHQSQQARRNVARKEGGTRRRDTMSRRGERERSPNTARPRCPAGSIRRFRQQHSIPVAPTRRPSVKSRPTTCAENRAYDTSTKLFGPMRGMVAKRPPTGSPRFAQNPASAVAAQGMSWRSGRILPRFQYPGWIPGSLPRARSALQVSENVCFHFLSLRQSSLGLRPIPLRRCMAAKLRQKPRRPAAFRCGHCPTSATTCGRILRPWRISIEEK